MIEIISGACGGFLLGWICRDRIARKTRTQAVHRATYKGQQITAADVIRIFEEEDRALRRQFGYQPRPSDQSGTPNQPPREP